MIACFESCDEQKLKPMRAPEEIQVDIMVLKQETERLPGEILSI